MCGITGIYQRRGEAPNPRVLDAMTDRLEHRGPDGRGTYLHEGVGFGHRRLSIIGLSTGAQPMANEDQTVWVTYNGEIYNYPDLKRELLERGHTFATESDTEVIVHGYEEWGEQIADRLRGIFAFALHDQRAGKVVCARDHLGVKPLYYHLTPQLLLFGSEAKALLEHPDMPRAPDLEAINLFLRYGYVPAPHCAFKGMRQLEPGHVLIVRSDRSDVRRYWSPPSFGTGRQTGGAEALDAVIDESVDIELMSEVPLGAFLSGGVDSSIVAASMAHSARLEAAPRTFCIGFPEPDFDESGHSKAVAEHLKLDHSVDMVSIDDLDILATLVDTYDEPFGDASAIPTYALCKMAQRHVTVALSGDGGDEVFAGYRRYRPVATYNELPTTARKWARRAADLYPLMIKGQQKLRRLGSTMANKYEIDLEYFPPQVVSAIVEPDLDLQPSWSLAAAFDAAPCDDPVAKAQWCDLVTYLPNDILVKVDRASMAHALEVRVPLLDHQLVEWASGLPMDQTFAEGRLKAALKDHLARRVPREIIERPKMGFGVPLEYWLGGRNGLRDLANRLADAHPRKRFFSPVRKDALDTLTASHVDEDFSQEIWGLLFLEKWWQRHFV